MALQPGEIETALTSYRETRQLMSPLVDFVIDKMLHDIDHETSRVFDDDEAVAVELRSTSRNLAPVLFVFWLDDDRFSLFIEDKEVLDDYVKDDSEIQKTLTCTKTVLSHEIFRVRYTRSGKLRKVIYTYSTITENGVIEKYEDKMVVGLSMPWSKNDRSEHLFEPWIVQK